ncbi:MAG: hypothetical protein EHM27_16180 [Deltaproteobacteria bacterium]|nr:MAG: hypothetical protein EHM27_16180 [Deltaproteobacteria bacterium]
MLEPLPRILTYVFLVSTMLSIGLTVTGSEILGTMRDRRLMGRLLLANFFLVPLLGYLLILMFPLSPGTKLALALLALAPGGLRAIQFTDKVKGNLAFAAAAFFVLSLLSIVFTPILVKVLLPLQIGMNLPFLRIILFVLVCLLIPLVVGFMIRGRSEKGAAAMGRVMLIVSNISFVATALVTAAMNKEAMRSLGGKTSWPCSFWSSSPWSSDGGWEDPREGIVGSWPSPPACGTQGCAFSSPCGPSPKAVLT